MVKILMRLIMIANQMMHQLLSMVVVLKQYPILILIILILRKINVTIEIELNTMKTPFELPETEWPPVINEVDINVDGNNGNDDIDCHGCGVAFDCNVCLSTTIGQDPHYVLLMLKRGGNELSDFF